MRLPSSLVVRLRTPIVAISKARLPRPLQSSALILSRPTGLETTRRSLSSCPSHLQQNDYNTPRPQNYSFYRTHGRAFFKSFTLAFLTYQILYWSWLTIEAEEIRDTKDAEIKSLENEVRLLDEGRQNHNLLLEKSRREGHRGYVNEEGDVEEREATPGKGRWV